MGCGYVEQFLYDIIYTAYSIDKNAKMCYYSLLSLDNSSLQNTKTIKYLELAKMMAFGR